MNNITDAASPLDCELWATVFEDAYATTKRSELTTLRNLVQRLLDTAAPEKSALPLIKLASFGDRRTKAGSLRSNVNMLLVYGAELDYDAERLTPEQIADALRQHNLAALVVTSPSHRDDAPRARILLPFSRPLRPADRAAMVSRAAGCIPDEIAGESWTPSQSYYAGRINGASAHRVIEVEGDFLDLRPDLDASAKPKRRTQRTNAPRGATAPKPNGVVGAKLPPGVLPVDAADALEAIATGNGSHEALLRLAGRWVAFGLPAKDIAAALLLALQRRPEAARDAGWQKAVDDVPRLVAWAEEREAEAGTITAPDLATPSPDHSNGADAGDKTSSDAGAAIGVQPADNDLDASIPPAYSDEALALAFAEQHQDRLRFVDIWGRWFLWPGAVWCHDDTLRVFSRVRLMLRRAASSCPKRKLQPVIASARTVAAVEKLARSDRRLAATVAQWDADAWLLNTLAGAVDLRTGRLQPHRLGDYCSKITAAAPGGDCPLWRKFLKQITKGDRKLQAFLQRFAGYCLTGITREHSFAFAHGCGGNGKSTFIDTLIGMMGDYAVTAAMETFTASHTNEHSTELAMLRGARLVVAQETEAGRRWAESRIKALTGGDPVTARFMRQDFFTFTPQFKLFVVGNHKPGLRNVDRAIRRRLLLIPFVATVSKPDLKLPEKLKAEWPGILAWAIEGCLAWQQIGLAPPPAVADATKDYFDAEDVVGLWIDEFCENDRSKASYSSALYSSFKATCELAGEFVPSQRWFSEALAARGYQPGRKTDKRTFIGLALKSGTGLVPP